VSRRLLPKQRNPRPSLLLQDLSVRLPLRLRRALARQRLLDRKMKNREIWWKELVRRYRD